jgi:hypothetical protein
VLDDRDCRSEVDAWCVLKAAFGPAITQGLLGRSRANSVAQTVVDTLVPVGSSNLGCDVCGFVVSPAWMVLFKGSFRGGVGGWMLNGGRVKLAGGRAGPPVLSVS